MLLYNGGMDKKAKSRFYIGYTLFFLLVSGLIVYYYYSHGRTMIDYGGDGFRQHFKALIYYSRYLRGLFSNFLKGDFAIPQWDFAISEGSDILKTFHYYGIGDIFTFFSFLCPERYMYLYYDGITLLRMYCAGLAFSALCFYKKKETTMILIGSLLYAFCAYNLTGMMGHVFFISAAVFLPLIILGCEKIICHDKPFLLSAAVMLSCLSNVYFFYMNVVSTVLFVAIRLLLSDDHLKEKALSLLKVGVYSILGVLMSAVIFLPILSTMFQSNRLDSGVSVPFLFSLSEYRKMFCDLTFDGAYLGGFSILWPIGLVALLAKKKDPTLIVLVIVSLLFVALPYLSMVFNAMTYPIDRWCYAVSLLMSYIIVDSFEDMEAISSSFVISIIVIVLYYGSCMYLERSKWQIHALLLLMSLVLILFVRLVKNERMRRLVCLAMIVFGLLFHVFYVFGPSYWGYYKNGTKWEAIIDMKNDEYSVFNEIDDDTFFRYSGNEMTTNQSMLGTVSSTQYYWSIANDHVVDFRKQLAYSDNSNHHYANYSERFSQNALSGVKYYVNKKDDQKIPYGFAFLKNINGYDVYTSDHALPMLFRYDNYILREDFEKYDAAKKNAALLKAAVLEKEISSMEKSSLDFDLIPVNYDLKKSQDIVFDEKKIEAHGPEAKLYLEGKCEFTGEYYVLLQGLYSDQLAAYIDVTCGDKQGEVTFKGTENQHYTDRHDYLVNLGYMDELNGTVTVRFSEGSYYDYESISLLCQPLESQIEDLKHLKDIQINKLQVEKGRVMASVSLDKDGLVCFSIPYSKGWKATIDGKEAEVLNCDLQYLALEMTNGSHTIELNYSTPLLKEGTMISLGSVVIYLFVLLLDKRKNKERI